VNRRRYSVDEITSKLIFFVSLTSCTSIFYADLISLKENIDCSVRLAAFERSEMQTQIDGEVPLTDLFARGFVFEGTSVSSVSSQGISKPKILQEILISLLE